MISVLKLKKYCIRSFPLIISCESLSSVYGQEMASLPPAGTAIIQSLSAADTALCISTFVGYIVTLTLAFLLHKQVNAVQESFNRCTSGVPCPFRRDKPDQEPEPESSTNLIEIMLISPRRTPDN